MISVIVSALLLVSQVSTLVYAETVSDNSVGDLIREQSAPMEEEKMELPTGGLLFPDIEQLPDDQAVAVPQRSRNAASSSSKYSSATLDEVFVKGAGTYGKSRLSAEQQQFYEKLEEAAVQFMIAGEDVEKENNSYYCSAGINFDRFGLSQSEAFETYVAFGYDHPGYYWINGFAYNSTQLFLRTSEQFAKASDRAPIDAQIVSGVKRYAAEAEKGTTSYEKTVILYDELAEAVDYAYKSDGVTPESEKWAHSVIGVFDESYSHVVCEGYANAFSLMLNYLGIPNVYIVGEAGTDGSSGGHAWNAVSFDGGETYSYVDLTWDDSWGCYYYFGMPKADFESSHIPDQPDGFGYNWLYELPDQITTDMSGMYYVREGFLYDSSSDLDGLIANVTNRVLGYGRNFSILTQDYEAMKRAYWKLEMDTYKPLTYMETDYYCLAKQLRATRYESPVSEFALDTASGTVSLEEDTYQLNLSSVTPEESDDYIFFSSTDTDVAIVEDPHVQAKAGNYARIRLKKVGTTEIKAVSSETGVSKVFSLTVTLAPVHVTGVSINKTAVILQRGSRECLTASVAPADADNQSVTWMSSNPSVVDVDESGTVTAVSVGTATVTVRTEDRGKTASCRVTVNPVPVQAVSLSKESLTLTEGDHERLTASVAPSDADNQSVTWMSSNPSVADVDARGEITAVSVGTATITVNTEDGDKTAHCYVTVEPHKYPVTVLAQKDGIIWGGSDAPKITIRSQSSLDIYENGSDLPNGIYDICVDGTDIGKTITVADGEVTETLCYYTITFLDDAGGNILQTDIMLSGSMPVYDGTEAELDYEDDEYLYWFQGWNPAITAAANQAQYYATYTKEPLIRIESLTLDKNDLRFALGKETGLLTATVLPSNTNEKILWESSDPSVATVDEQGTVTPHADGTCTIRACTRECIAECEVRVLGAFSKYIVDLYKDGVVWTGADAPKLLLINQNTGDTYESGAYLEAGTYEIMLGGERTGKTVEVADAPNATVHISLNYTTATPEDEIDDDDDFEENTDLPDGDTDQQSEKEAIKVGDTFTVKKLQYKVTGVKAGSLTVTLTKNNNSKAKTVSIPKTVKYKGKSFKVTAVAAKAFRQNQKLEKVTIGANVKTIGANAFKDCKKLKKINVKGSVVKKVGKNALKGIHKNCRIKVPKKKVATYQKLFGKAGLPKSAKVTK